MAQIEYFKIPGLSNDALFTVVEDTDLYNTITSSTVVTLFPWNKVKLTVVMPGLTQMSQVTLNKIIERGISIAYSFTQPLNSDKYYEIANNKYARVYVNGRGGTYVYIYNNGVQSTVTNNALPVAICDQRGVYSPGADSGELHAHVLLTNDEKTSAKVVYITISSVSSTTYNVYNINNFDPVTFFDGLKPAALPNPDPYTEGSGNHSGGGGGTGRFSRTGETVGEHNVPTLSATDAGFITLFAPTAGEMKALASYLWSDLFSIDTFKKIFANPMDAILGLSIVPVAVPTSGSASVKVGNISTGVSMTKASTQYVKLSCGSLEVEEYWGAYLDYSPYTKCEIYLPYIGVHELSVDDVMGKTVKVVYYIDILSGACTAEIYSNSTCLYSFVGQCSASIPITGNDWTNVINGVMQIGASIGSMVASGGLTAPISAGGVAQGLKSVASASSTVTSSKPSVERSGSMSGAGGMLGQQTPYLIITWPRECIPADQNKYIGYPSYVTVNLGDIVGFNIIDSIHLENIPATSAELDEIESLLMNGVIF